MLRLALLSAALACAASQSSPALVQSLSSASGVSWRLRNTNGSIEIPTDVPGAAHLALLAAGLVGEPYAALNVDAQAWIAEEPLWTFSCSFTPSAAVLAASVVELVAEGIETVVSVSLNGAPLFSSTSAFRRNVARVSLLPGANVLAVAISSPIAAAAAAAAACTGFCPPLAQDPNETAAIGFNYLRAPPVSFGWDFAPAFVGSSIWRDIFLRAYTAAVLDEVTVVTTAQSLPVPRGDVPSPWRADFVVWASGGGTSTGATVNVTVDGIGSASARGVVAPGAGSQLRVSLPAPAALAWWPAGLGAPALYNATVTLTADGGSASAKTFAFGFRSVELRQPPAPNGGIGSLYTFAVNGVAFYSKGANWVPTDAFPVRIASPATLTPKLETLADAGFNTLRVWGGGHPQASSFYDEAARLGLFLWHEMPFACQSYPASGVGGLLETVAAETADIVRHIQRAPILAYGGNNEIGQIQHYAPGSPGWFNYSALFFGAVRTALLAVDASRPFIVSSPGSAAETPEAPIASPPMQPALGDMHIYVYHGDCWNVSNYPSARAVSEFGWQSFSSLPAMAELISPDQFDYWSPENMRRDTHPSQPEGLILFQNVGSNWLVPGYNASSPLPPAARYSRLAGAAAAAAASARAANATSTAHTQRADGSWSLPTDALGVPAMLAGAPGGLAAGTVYRDQLMASQLAQAMCVRVEAEHYRRSESSCLSDPAGAGCTAVSLIWMAADLWPGATKGSIEWGGRPKALHYAERRFYAPVLLSLTAPTAAMAPPDSAIFAAVLSAQPPAGGAGIAAGRLLLTCWSWAAGALGTRTLPFAIPAWPGPAAQGGAVLLYNDTLASTLAACGCTGGPAACVVVGEAYDVSGAAPVRLAPQNWFHPAPLRDVTTMRDPGLAIAAVEPVPGAPGAFVVTLTAARLPAAGVWLESLLCCGRFSDNDFFMTQSPLNVTYTPGADARGWVHAPPPGAETRVTAGQFAASLTITSLLDMAGYGA